MFDLEWGDRLADELHPPPNFRLRISPSPPIPEPSKVLVVLSYILMAIALSTIVGTIVGTIINL